MTRPSFAFLVLSLTACGGPQSAPERCDVRYEGQCYASSSEACAAAGCPPDRCTILRTDPGQVSCDAD